jgi:hypothetical protein
MGTVSGQTTRDGRRAEIYVRRKEYFVIGNCVEILKEPREGNARTGG